jgi:hypothetical protein
MLTSLHPCSGFTSLTTFTMLTMLTPLSMAVRATLLSNRHYKQPRQAAEAATEFTQ